jgi:hypothetical protein
MARQQIDYAGVVLAMDPEQEERKQVRSQLQWDYGQVPALHRKAVEDAAVEILVSGRKMQQSVLVIGQRLGEVKRLLDHGQFGDWCEREFGMNVRTAQRMMSVAANLDGKSDKLSHLGTSVLYLIGADSTPEPVREAVIQQAESTGRSPSVAEVRKSIRFYRDDDRAAPAPSGTSAAQPAGLALISGAVLEERVKQEIMQHYMRPMNQGEALWAANDMRREAQRKDGKFWRRVCVMPTTVDEIADCVLRLADEVTIGFDRWLPKPAGQPLMQVLATDEERQALAASDLQVMQTAPAAPTERVVSEREAELQRWWVRLIGMQSDLHNWADLTGRHVATGECERGLRKMLEITERELALLRGEVVEGESEGWG